jgi:thiamine transport system permease protein
MSNPEVLKALKLSFALAVWSSSLTIFTAVMVLIFLFHSKMSVRFRSQMGFLFGLPSGVSVIVLGLGVWFAYGRWIDPFEGSPAAMILLQVTLFFPLALRALWSVASSSNQRTMDAAKSLGASLVRAWLEVEWSRWRGPLIVAFGSVFGAVLGEVGAVSLFASEKWVSLPGLISQSMQHYRFDEAQILSGILLTTSLLVSLGAMEFGKSLGGAVSE